jgi:hypothetical protein
MTREDAEAIAKAAAEARAEVARLRALLGPVQEAARAWLAVYDPGDAEAAAEEATLLAVLRAALATVAEPEKDAGGAST